MQQEIKTVIENFASAALATNGPEGLNVVPISVVNVRGDEIHLYDFFMNRTAKNIKASSLVAFTCWRDFVGVQVKAEVVYETEGEDFDLAVKEMKERFPDRTLSGLIRLTPVEVYDVAPGASPDDLLKV
ncbi:pyridoxamine 5'-phosphate oxidase family protein [Candidatus Nomurabacteria bacterium]|nr:pyridoxamine 5'-phosphate oxidase family protein [Candidatus Nomurabacteria bacterium]MCB9818037.1 pyridoxamine 5'-phosphate oxidase family protein [Candidatus Nomurabacteria bacterium]